MPYYIQAAILYSYLFYCNLYIRVYVYIRLLLMEHVIVKKNLALYSRDIDFKYIFI